MSTSNPVLHGLVLKTTDPEEAAACLSGAAVPYVSEPLAGSPPFSTEIFVTEGQQLSLTRVVTRGAMRVNAALPADAYAIVLDLQKGLGAHFLENKMVPVGPEFALVQSPLQPVEVHTNSAFEALFLRIDRQGLIRELEKLLGRDARTELVFAPELRLASAAGRQIRQLCDRLRRTLYTTDESVIRKSPEIAQIEREILTLLLQAQPHNYRRFLHRHSSAGPWQVRAAEEFMCSNAHLPISLGDVCQAAGVNARTLQDSFQKKRGCTPMEFLRNSRLNEVRAALATSEGNTTVTGEAARWGFMHFGRFSREYQARFGELPSETLRRARRSARVKM